MKPEIVHATAELLAAFYGEPPLRTIRGFVAVLDGEPICIAGTFTDRDRKVAFADMRDRMRAFPKTGMKMARCVVSQIRESRVPVFAVADELVEAAPRFLIRLGFQPIREGVYAWLA